MRQYVRLGSVGAKNWGNRPVAIVGGGPSLRGFDFNRLRDRFTVLAVNASMFDIPFAAAGFSIDNRAIREWWLRLRLLEFDQYYAVPDNKLKISHPAPTTKMHFVRRYQGTEFTISSDRITAGGTSGFGALHLAFLKGAQRIVLFGYDYGAAASVWHHNESHYTFRQNQNDLLWDEWAQNFNRASAILKKHKVEVINASPESRITAFPKCSIEEAMQI